MLTNTMVCIPILQMRNRFNEVKIGKVNFSGVTVLVSGRAGKSTRVSDLQPFVLSYSAPQKSIFLNV